MTTYFVRLRGMDLGQATIDELRRQAERGQLTPFHKLSSDGQQWVGADKIPGIFPGSAPPPDSPPDQTLSAADLLIPVEVAPEEVPAPSVSEWFLFVDGEQCGPFDKQEVIRQIQQRQATAEARVWTEGMEDWEPITRRFGSYVRRIERQDRRERRRQQRQQRLASIPPEEKSVSILAIASLVLSVLWLFGIFSLCAILLGLIGGYDILTSEGRRLGLPYAIGGVVLGGVGIAVAVVFVL